ncbi:hypothetical protein D3C80_1105950 [compost metagenome]
MIGRNLDIAFLHPAVAPPHAEQPAGHKQQGRNEVAQRRLADKECLDRHKAHRAQQQAHRGTPLTPRGQLRPLVRVFGDRRNHRPIRTVHQAVEQPEQHKQNGSEGGFHRQVKIIRHKLRRRRQRDGNRSIENKRPEFTPGTNVTP